MELVLEEDANDFGHGSSNGAGHADRHVEPPAPIAIIAAGADWVVWLSAPRSVLPGVAKRSQWSVADAVSGP